MAGRVAQTAVGIAMFFLATSILSTVGDAVWAQQERSPSDTPIEPTVPAAETAGSETQEASSSISVDALQDEPPRIVTEADPLSLELQQIVSRAIQDLDPERLPKFEAAKANLQDAIADLECYVDLNSERGQAWSRFLKLNAIQQELESERPNLAKLADYEMNMRQNYLGLEYAPFLAVRGGLNEVVRSLKYGSNPERTMQVLNSRMQGLMKTLDEPSVGSGIDRSAAVGRVANYLYESGQVPWAVTELQQKFNRPNIQICAPESLINRLVMRPVAEPSPVNECLLGTRIIGRACLSGDVSVDVLPMTGGVSVKLNMAATMTSNNLGYNRGVVLRSTGASPVFASKQILITPHGMSSMPATVATDLRTRIHSIEHRLKIVRRIAKRKAAEQKPLADAIAQGRLQRRIGSQYDQQVTQQLAEAETRLSALQSPPPELTRLGISQPALAMYSTDSAVHADVVQAAAFQLAAPEACQIERPRSSGILIEAHQSAAINALERLLGGRTIRHHDLDDFAMQVLGEVPPEILEEVNGDPWEITMASYNPVQLELDDQSIKFTLRISRMEGKERTLGSGAIISAKYYPSYQDGILTLQRDGELEIEVPGVRSAIQATNYRSIVKAKFDPIFKDEIVTEKFQLTDWFPKLQVALDIQRFEIDDGWIQVEIR